jgi:hypothetical protein
MRDVHHISEYRENDLFKQKNEGPPYSYPSTIINEQFRNSNHNTSKMDYYEHYEHPH